MEPSKNQSSTPTAPKSPIKAEPGAPARTGGPTPGIGSDAKELATQVVDRAKGLAEEQVTDRQEKSAGQIDMLAKALHRTSEDMSDSMAAPYIEKAADALDRMSGSVRDASFADAVRSTESFARREPLLFLGGALALGLLAARFIKSSAHRDDDSDRELTSGGARRS